MRQSEPPSSGSCSSLFFIGRDRRGNWVVQDQEHLRGGLFISRAEAIKFALFENGHRPQAVVMAADVIELDMGRKSNPPHPPASNPVIAQVRRAA